MLLDVLSQSNYESYNIKFAKMFGLNTAIYLNLLLDINSKAIKKDKIDDEYFTLDRGYIEDRTTLKESTQKKIDSTLIDYGIIKTDSENKISIDLNIITGIILRDEKQKPEQVKAKKPINKKLTDKEKIADLKTKIYLPCEQLHKPLEDWIDSVYAKDRWMSYKAVINGQRIIEKNSYNNGINDINIALQIIDIATINGYRDMEWAVNAYHKNHPSGTITSKKFEMNDNTNLLSNEEIIL